MCYTAEYLLKVSTNKKVSAMKNTKTLKKQKLIKGNILSDQCPSREILNHVTSRWGVLILFALSDGEVKRFSELRRQIQGISEKMLTQTLKTLEADGFVNRHAYNVIPPVVEYSLTPNGKEIACKVIDLVGWIEDNLVKVLRKRA